MLDKIFGRAAAWGPFFLRVAVGVVFIMHGAQKLFGAFGGPGLKGFSQMIAGMGLRPVMAWATAVALIEFVGGIFLLLGFMTRLSALLTGVVMAVAVIFVHMPNGFFAKGGGIEFPLVLFAACLCLLLTGGGRAVMRE
jgi:putative oxidoreductase